MTKLTLKIIHALKHDYVNYDSLRETLIHCMMEYADCPREAYTKDRVEGIIFQAFADFMETVDSPRMQLYQLRDCIRINLRNPNYDIYDAMLATMQLVEVCSGDYYVNGFDASYRSIE